MCSPALVCFSVCNITGDRVLPKEETIHFWAKSVSQILPENIWLLLMGACFNTVTVTVTENKEEVLKIRTHMQKDYVQYLRQLGGDQIWFMPRWKFVLRRLRPVRLFRDNLWLPTKVCGQKGPAEDPRVEEVELFQCFQEHFVHFLILLLTFSFICCLNGLFAQYCKSMLQHPGSPAVWCGLSVEEAGGQESEEHHCSPCPVPVDAIRAALLLPSEENKSVCRLLFSFSY